MSRTLRNARQGVPPATLAEFTLQGDGWQDWYDGTSPITCGPLHLVNAHMSSLRRRRLRPPDEDQQQRRLPRCRLPR